jgi:hypothetical protein
MGLRETRSREDKAERVRRWRDKTAKLFFRGLGRSFLAHPAYVVPLRRSGALFRRSGFLDVRESLA